MSTKNVKYYAYYDAITGNILGFFSDEIHGDNIPDPNIEITEKEWHDAVLNQDRRKVSRETLKIVETLSPTPTSKECLAKIRKQRDRLLAECDWTQIPDNQLSPAEREAWQKYRQALRDFPATCNPYNSEWPKK